MTKKKKKKAAYNLPQRIYLSGHTQVELGRMVQANLEIPLSAVEFNQIIHCNTGNGPKAVSVRAEADRIVSEWEEQDG